MICKHADGVEMKNAKMVSETYEGEVTLSYKAYCNFCGKRLKEYDEEKVYSY